MPTNRTRIAHAPRRPRFSAEVLALFWELEHSPYNDHKSKKLALALGLWDEYFLSGCHVNDKATQSCHPPNYPATEDFEHCRAIRAQLLQAIKDQPPRLTESEVDTIYTAATPLPVERHDAFLEHVVTHLPRVDVGPGDVHRAVTTAQRKFFDPPNLDRMNGINGYELKLRRK
jgi:hypothetical protein